MKILSSRPLYIQVIFTILAFAAMVFLSNLFLRDTVHHNLVRNAESVFKFAQTQLESDLLEPRTILSGYSQTIRSMILRGDNINDILNYTRDIASYFHSGGSRIMSSIDLYGYFELFDETVFVGFGTLPENYDPRIRPWFLAAVEGGGSIIETPPYISMIDGKKIITYARCIYDLDGKDMGIVCLNIKIEDIGENILEIALDQGGYGILISQDFKIIAHVNPDFIGRDIGDSDIPISIFMEDFLADKDVLEQPLTNWIGERTVAFFRKLENGWYLGLLTPEKPFYQSLTYMALVLFVFGAIFAAALIVILIKIDKARAKSDQESKHKSAFLANMSHEIRTPMNAIIGMTTIGKSSPKIERKDYCFSKIEDASNHLLGVINDILDMSKIEANKFGFSLSEFNFERMLQRAVNVVNFRVDEKKQKLAVYIDPNIPKTLIGDDQRIVQVITNLLGNAIKFTPEKGSISLDTRFILEDHDNICTIRISVTDTGIGLNAEQQERIFTSFEQAETSTSRKYGGTGLGLPISKNIVEMMGGRIWVISELDKGSTFIFELKMKRGIQPYRGLLSPDINLNNVRVMVVDDDKDILDYFMVISREFKIQCDTAISGKEAIRIVEENGHYHIYFVDWNMPGMDGIELASELKAHNEPVKSVVIMITAAEWTMAEKEAREAGVDKFLSKPLFPSQIADILNEILGIDRDHIEESRASLEGLFAGRHVLLAEDVEINRDIVKALLEPTDIDIDCAENGKDVVEKFSAESYKYDLILMDVQMPEMDGYEATRRIRALNIPQAQTVKIIAMTANVFREDIEKCFEAGMDNHIGKPLDLDELIDKMCQYMPEKQ